MKGKHSMPNSGAGNRGGSGKSGSNNGKTGGLRKENPQRADVVQKPSTTNHYPRGLA